MGKKIDIEAARTELQTLFDEAAVWHAGAAPEMPADVVAVADVLFSSGTQSYRETLVGCGLARLMDETIDIRHPYTAQSGDAYSGRTLDEKVINPLLQQNQIPCSKGPFLATFRRNVTFDIETRGGLKDKVGYDAFLEYIGFFEAADAADVRRLLTYLLYRFLVLREAADIPVARIARLSLEQLHALISGLLVVPSGGLLPLLIVASTLETIKNGYNLPWNISRQGINEADAATGAGGDVTVSVRGEVLLAIEVTERPVGRERVVATFNTKISTNAIRDYIFATTVRPDDAAFVAARGYFAQGHEIVFVDILTWAVNTMASFGAGIRERFISTMADALAGREVSVAVKQAWNRIIQEVVET